MKNKIIGLLIMASIICFNVNCSSNDDNTWYDEGYNGAVVAGGKEATEAGVQMLEDGGNAADAAVATILALSITDYGFFAIGGEVPLMIYNKNLNEVKVVSGVGYAPKDTTSVNWYYENEIPKDGGIKAVPIPSAFDVCITTIKSFGTMSFEKVIGPSLKLLENGDEDWHKSLLNTYHKLIDIEKQTTGSREDKLEAVRDMFYKGEIADILEEYYIKEGSFLRKSDLASFKATIEDPVKIEYKGYTIYKCNTWTQGPYLLQTLNILDNFDLNKMGHLSTDYIHVLTEALKLGLADRDEYYGDPLFSDIPINELLSKEYANIRSELIDLNKASLEFRPGDPINMKPLKSDYSEPFPTEGGTTTCVVADKWGNIVSATPSANRPYSIASELGIAHGNRLRSLNTKKGHPNSIEPGKRPRITLTPTIVTKDNQGVLAISVAGGDTQDQTTLNCLLNFIDFEMLPKDAVTQPRFSTSHYQNSFNPNQDRNLAREMAAGLKLNEEINESIQSSLKERGHIISTTNDFIGTPAMIYIDPNTKMIYAAGDPKTKRNAIALKD